MYCSIDDVRKRNPLLLGVGGISDADVTDAIGYASSLVDGILKNRYPVPITPVPELIRGITADLAAADCIGNAAGSDGDDKEPARSKELREKAMDLLDMLRQGESDIPDESGDEQVVMKLISTTYDRPRIFDRWNPADPTSDGRL